MNEHITERDFAQHVYGLARLYHWYVYRTHDSRHSPAGYPDLSMVLFERHVYAEIKTEKGELTRAQCQWLCALYEAGHEVFVWRPSYWWQAVDTLSGGQ